MCKRFDFKFKRVISVLQIVYIFRPLEKFNTPDGSSVIIVNRSENGVAAEEGILCALVCKRLSVITVKREFRRKYYRNAPTSESIRRWYEQFKETGCLCQGKSPGRPGLQ
ncbi:hypothetical protein TNCV_3565591 [Trichonephila clavipes]|nr:hypothetical protein TNCV_3565591 [Trichonephila clavipes]